VSRLPGPISSRRVYDGDIVHLRVSEYRRPDGLIVRREVIDHPGAAVIVPLEDDRVLMVRQPRDAVERLLLELPAGKRDGPDEDPLECAKRELAEEVGRSAAEWRELAGFYTAPAILTEFIWCYLATGLSPVPAHPTPEEDIEVVAWPLDDLPSLLDEVRDAKSLVGLLRLARELGF
jgi:ADP-ribose pyrophosphatase